MISVTPPLRQKLAAAFHEALPGEACGLLLGSRSGAASHAVDIALPAGASSSIGQFELPDHEIARMRAHAASRGLDIVAMFHSHPSGHRGLSVSDLAALRYSQWPWIVLTMDGSTRLTLTAFASGTAERLDVIESESPPPAARCSTVTASPR